MSVISPSINSARVPAGRLMKSSTVWRPRTMTALYPQGSPYYKHSRSCSHEKILRWSKAPKSQEPRSQEPRSQTSSKPQLSIAKWLGGARRPIRLPWPDARGKALGLHLKLGTWSLFGSWILGFLRFRGRVAIGFRKGAAARPRCISCGDDRISVLVPGAGVWAQRRHDSRLSS